jgi:hypothetical protein
LNLDEIGRLLDPDFDVNASMRRNATQVMQRRMFNSVTPANCSRRRWKCAISPSGSRPDESDSRRAGCQRSALKNRSDRPWLDHRRLPESREPHRARLVLAALIVGAAMLMRVQTPFTILGYPGLAMLLFLAAGGAFWMAWTILAGTVKARRRRNAEFRMQNSDVRCLHSASSILHFDYLPCFSRPFLRRTRHHSGCAPHAP